MTVPSSNFTLYLYISSAPNFPQAKADLLQHEDTIFKSRPKNKRHSSSDAARTRCSRALLMHGGEKLNIIDLVFDLFQTYEAQPFCVGVLSQLFLVSALKHYDQELRRQFQSKHGKKSSTNKGFDLMSRLSGLQQEGTNDTQYGRSQFLDGEIYDRPVHRMLFQRFVHMLPKVSSFPAACDPQNLLLQMLGMIQNMVFPSSLPSPED